MVELLLPRRRFLAGLVGLVAAPAVVRIASLAPVKALPPKPYSFGALSTLAERQCAERAAKIRAMETSDMMRLYDSVVLADG